MSWSDLKNFLQVYFGVILVVAVLGLIMRRPELDEFDFLHALILASVSTICRAIHATTSKGSSDE